MRTSMRCASCSGDSLRAPPFSEGRGSLSAFSITISLGAAPTGFVCPPRESGGRRRKIESCKPGRARASISYSEVRGIGSGLSLPIHYGIAGTLPILFFNYPLEEYQIDRYYLCICSILYTI